MSNEEEQKEENSMADFFLSPNVPQIFSDANHVNHFINNS